MSREELAWAAGFVDGEGCFHTATRRVGKVRNYPCLVISQRSRLVLDRFLSAVGGLGYINGPYSNRGEGAFYYRVNGFEKTQAIIAQLWAFLSPVKRAQAARVLRSYHEVRV